MYRGDSLLHTFPFPYDRLFQITTSNQNTTRPRMTTQTTGKSGVFTFSFFSFLFFSLVLSRAILGGFWTFC